MSKDLIKNKRKILISLIVIIGLLGYFLYYSIQVNSLTKLGYTKQQAHEMVKLTTIYNIVTNSKEELSHDINQHIKTLDNLGVTEVKVNNLISEADKLVEKENVLDEYASEHKEKMDKDFSVLKKQADIFNIKYDLKNKTLYQQVTYLDKLVSKKIDGFIEFLMVNGFSTKEIKALTNESEVENATKLQKVVTAQKKELEKNLGFQSDELKNQAMRMFKLTNDYRKSLGLKPYVYNYQKQSCVFKEARAYAGNNNPHNWVCPTANENASIASIKSDYVAIAMRFFKTDPPHEAVLSGNYKSVAIAFVEKNGIVYMIMDVFN